MKTNKFTTQKLFCTLLFNLLVMGVFAQFTPNAAGAPEEPIPEPEVEGASCETAIEIQSDTSEGYGFEEGQERLFFEFLASSDSMFILTEEESIEDEPFTGLIAYEVYLKNSCEDLIEVYNHSVNDSTLHYFGMTNLTEGENYLLVLRRDENNDLPEITFAMLLEDIYINCPQSYVDTCGELIKNPEFNYLSQSVAGGTARPFQVVCDWNENSGTPQIKGTLNSQAYAYLVANVSLIEAIETAVSLTPDNYIVSLDVAATGTNPPPDELRVILRDTITNTGQIIYTIPGSSIQPSASGHPKTFQTKSICFSTTQPFNKLIITPYNGYSNRVYCDVLIDNVSIKKMTLDAGPDVSVIQCNEEKTIGPDCILPGVTYSWTPNVGLSDPNIANPIVSKGQSGIYTLTMNSACTTITDQIYITFSGSNHIDVIPLNNANSSQLFSIIGNNSGNISNRIFRIEGTLTLDTSVSFINCSFYMGEDAKIVVNNNASVVFYNNNSNIKEEFFTSCSPDKYWDGIYQTNGSYFVMWGNDTISYNKDTIAWRISNSKNGINLVNVEDVNIEDIHFENNGRALSVENTGTNTTNAKINHHIIQCTQPLNYGNGEFYPQTAIDLKNIRTRPSGYYSDQFDIRNVVLNSSGGNIQLANSEVVIGNVDFSGFNNYYQSPGEPDKSDKSIVAYGGDANAKLKVIYSSFIGSWESIRLQDQYSIEIRNNYVNSAGIPDASFLRATDVSNLSTIQGSNLNQISNNTILNVKKGVELYNSHYFRINNNYFDMEVQPDSNYYTKNNNEESVAIYANGYSENPYVVSHQALIENNVIAHSKVGIQVSMMWSSIKDNNIKNLNNRFTAPSFCFPIQSPCPTTPSYGIRAMNSKVYIEGNTVENELNKYSGTMPNTQEEMVGISLENLSFAGGRNLDLYCNRTENTGIGLRFAGYNGYSSIYKNLMKGNNIGFALDNEAFIGDVGMVISIPVYYQDAGNEWVGTFGNSHTFNFSNDDPNNPPKYYYKGTGPIIGQQDAALGYFSIEDIVTSNDNTITCTAPLMVDHSSGKKEATTAYNKSGKKPRWLQKGNASDSAFYLRQQLKFYHLSKDSALYNSQQFSSFRDSMKNTTLGRALGKNSQSIRSLSAQNNFDQNVSTVEPLLDKHFVDSVLSSSELDQLRQIAVLCPYTDGIAVYQARRVLHEYGERLYVNECEISQLPNNQKFIRIKAEEKQDKVPFAIYPNPADEQLNISYSVEEDEEIVLEIYDVLGKKIMTKSLNSGHLHQINTSQLQHGVYIYRLFKSKEQINSGKLVIE
ncbi:MAG: hypothetical protein CMC96_06130 [Flavobacteriales bacterium]|nr:hypothetical protein [Flavobacteriales bacterium]